MTIENKCAEFNSDRKTLQFTVGANYQGQRLDQFLSDQGKLIKASFSRSLFQELIKQNKILVDGVLRKARYRLRENEIIDVVLPELTPVEITPEKIDFTILFEDDSIIVLSKPAGLVVHPACGNYSGTLVNGLLYHCQDFVSTSGKIRPGIVHRLDKDTTGVMVVAKNGSSLQNLIHQFKYKKVVKEYLALVKGRVVGEGGKITTLIGRHPVNRKKMAVVSDNGKEAITNWRVLERFEDDFVLLKVHIETGRTHQIRVHMAANGTPVAGDMIYGRTNNSYKDLGIKRQLLHASSLTIDHPKNGKNMIFSAPLHEDMDLVLKKLKRNVP